MAVKDVCISEEQKALILNLLRKILPKTKVWIYGSRVNGKCTEKSDLDMVVFAKPEQKLQLMELKEAFAESNLPFRVDLFVWHELPKEFQKTIRDEHADISD
ncbi:MAG: nucleotidyltransferase family protein [Candidatus Rifleibacteriota bacterium]